jgi:preprotein translocase subunit SecA
MIEDNFVRYMFHIDVQVLEQDEKPRQPVRRLNYSAPEDPVQGSDALQAAGRSIAEEAAAAAAMPNGEMSTGAVPSAMQTSAPEEQPIQPVRVEKTPGRNEPCWCGSGKKFKLCHGR